jgi:hypothetical protein
MDDSDPVDFSNDKYDNYPSNQPLPF